MAIKSFAQKALWAALDDPSNASLREKFREEYRFYRQAPDGDPTHPLVKFPVQPGISNMPALLIVPIKGNAVWNANQHQKYTVNLLGIIWVAHADLELAEDLHDEIRSAFWKTRNPATNLEHWRGTPATVSWWNFRFEDWSFAIEPVDPKASQPQWCTRLQWQMTFETNSNPTI